MTTLHVKTGQKKDVVDLTDRINEMLSTRNVTDGACCISVAHTTAALTTGEVGEGTEQDLLDVAEQVIPKIRFRHAHDPSHAWSHMAASLIGPSLCLPVSEGKLALGTWQSVLLIELDGPRQRTVHVTLLPGA
jgi:secondary thiamine-phosphate synthase enzyme